MAETLNARFQRFTTGLSQKYEPHVREHLAKVYMVLGCTIAASTFGATLHLLHILQWGFALEMAALLLVVTLNCHTDNGKHYYTRLSMLLAFGFCSGQALGLFMEDLNQAIILTALVGTCVIFLSLSISALLAERGEYLYLGGSLIGVVNVMAVISLCNLFFESYFVHRAQLYIGVFVMAAFVLYDTQKIVERCRNGNQDVVQHALDLFFNVFSLFRRLLSIIKSKGDRKDEGSKKR